jgi:hypothetical protein
MAVMDIKIMRDRWLNIGYIKGYSTSYYDHRNMGEKMFNTYWKIGH